jgi:hypothetical protein
MHPDSDRFPHDIALWDLTPNATITAIVTVVAHHKVMPWLNDDREIPWAPAAINLHVVAICLW